MIGAMAIAPYDSESFSIVYHSTNIVPIAMAVIATNAKSIIELCLFGYFSYYLVIDRSITVCDSIIHSIQYTTKSHYPNKKNKIIHHYYPCVMMTKAPYTNAPSAAKSAMPNPIVAILHLL